MRYLEVAVFNYESALVAKKAGVDRIEVCEDYAFGGVTPSIGFIEKVSELDGMDIFVMIRQRTDNFVYSNKEMDLMFQDIELYKKMNIHGFVFGSLDKNKKVHTEFCKGIVNAANPLPVTFHRACDLCDDLNRATEEVIDCGFKRILTSGGKSNAFEGRFVIRDLIKKYGKSIIFIPGGGIRSNNISEIEVITKAKEFHTSGIRNNQKGINPKLEAQDIIDIKKI